MTRRNFWLATALAASLYGTLLYAVDRTAWPAVLGLFGGLFGLYAWQLHTLGLRLHAPLPAVVQPPLRQRDLLGAALLLRLVALGALPELSDDYFRFVWDGRLWNHGVNPFATLPSTYMEDPAQAAQLGLTPELYQGLNSPHYYTIYPPVLQAIFGLSTALFPQSVYGAVLVMKLFILGAELGSLALLTRLLARQDRSPRYLALYALHPLVIVELCGNLHFEALMIFFLLGSLWCLRLGPRPRWGASALLLALGVATKLLPLMLLPLLIRRLGWGRAIAYGAAVLLLTALLFAPLLDRATLLHLGQSLDLYFHRFEFNASLYYLVRWGGYLLYDQNLIRLVGGWLALAALLAILLYTGRERRPRWDNLPQGMLWILTLYLAFSPVVHPWYATPLLALAPLTRWRWPLIWSALLPLSYFTYRHPDYPEDLRLTALIYLGGLAWGLWEGLARPRPD